ncbi:hypothetical protein HMPREF1494_1768 [Bifidobacterium sp. MSTE12]|nr:hypothetical protein HMPREF1494_1768 [Bifidobacterium sp. MSTE12]
MAVLHGNPFRLLRCGSWLRAWAYAGRRCARLRPVFVGYCIPHKDTTLFITL